MKTNYFINDRSNLTQSVCYYPVEKRSYNMLEDLQRNPNMYRRNDVILENTSVTCEHCSGTGTKISQKVVYLTESGFGGDLSILERISPEDLIRVYEIAKKMRENAVTHPETAVFIHKS